MNVRSDAEEVLGRRGAAWVRPTYKGTPVRLVRCRHRAGGFPAGFTKADKPRKNHARAALHNVVANTVLTGISRDEVDPLNVGKLRDMANAKLKERFPELPVTCEVLEWIEGALAYRAVIKVGKIEIKGRVAHGGETWNILFWEVDMVARQFQERVLTSAGIVPSLLTSDVPQKGYDYTLAVEIHGFEFTGIFPGKNRLVKIGTDRVQTKIDPDRTVTVMGRLYVDHAHECEVSAIATLWR